MTYSVTRLIRHLTLIGTILGVALSSGLQPTAAEAAASPPASQSHPTQVKIPMTAVSINPSIAHAHGYKVITLSDGRQASVPEISTLTDGASPAQVQPYDVVNGNCGYDFLFVFPQGNLYYDIFTGFHISGAVAAVEYSWEWDITDFGGYNIQKTSVGGLAFRYDWSILDAHHINFAREIYGNVITGPSWAFLADGVLCYGSAASDEAYVS